MFSRYIGRMGCAFEAHLRWWHQFASIRRDSRKIEQVLVALNINAIVSVSVNEDVDVFDDGRADK